MTTYLNLGCGERFHPEWINIDLVAGDPMVVRHNLAHGIPFPAESADAVYQAAVFEHIRKGDAGKLLKEIYRVLKPGGVVRIGVPDLEKICRLYLEKLAAASAGEPGAEADYDWILLEMLDQMVREKSGGEMLDYLRQNPLPNEKFVYQRIGNEGRELVRSLKKVRRPVESGKQHSATPVGSIWRQLRRKMRALLLGHDAEQALSIGRFRLGGEVHQWMYDRYSLGRELVAAGFEQIIVRSPGESAIPDWPRFHLDVAIDGSVNKPDLLFMEAIKPGIGTE